MNGLALFLGITVLVCVSHDFIFTTVSINGAGPISKRLSAFIARLFLKLSIITQRRTLLRYSGASVILSLICWWIGGLWLGFFLLLLSDQSSIINASPSSSVDTMDKIYYSAYVLSTMGNGDFIPGSSLWQIIVGIFSFSGFIFITTAMTYLISVSSAVIHKRSLALQIADIMSLTEDEGRLAFLINHSNELRGMINKHTQNHLAYPIVHFFISINKNASFSFGLNNLNELLIQIQESSTSSIEIKPFINAIDNLSLIHI